MRYTISKKQIWLGTTGIWLVNTVFFGIANFAYNNLYTLESAGLTCVLNFSSQQPYLTFMYYSVILLLVFGFAGVTLIYGKIYLWYRIFLKRRASTRAMSPPISPPHASIQLSSINNEPESPSQQQLDSSRMESSSRIDVSHPSGELRVSGTFEDSSDGGGSNTNNNNNNNNNRIQVSGVSPRSNNANRSSNVLAATTPITASASRTSNRNRLRSEQSNTNNSKARRISKISVSIARGLAAVGGVRRSAAAGRPSVATPNMTMSRTKRLEMLEIALIARSVLITFLYIL